MYKIWITAFLVIEWNNHKLVQLLYILVYISAYTYIRLCFENAFTWHLPDPGVIDVRWFWNLWRASFRFGGSVSMENVILWNEHFFSIYPKSISTYYVMKCSNRKNDITLRSIFIVYAVKWCYFFDLSTFYFIYKNVILLLCKFVTLHCKKWLNKKNNTTLWSNKNSMT